MSERGQLKLGIGVNEYISKISIALSKYPYIAVFVETERVKMPNQSNKNTTLRSLNNQFSVRKWPIKLVKDKGYCYLVYDTGAKYNSKTIMVPRINDLSVLQWLKEAEDFKAEMEA